MDEWVLITAEKNAGQIIVTRERFLELVNIHRLHVAASIFIKGAVTTIHPYGYKAKDVKEFFEANGFECHIYGLR